MNNPPVLFPAKSPVRRKRRGALFGAPPSVDVLLAAVHVQQDTQTLEFVFDADIVSVDGVSAEQFQCAVDGEPVNGDSVESFGGASIIVNFARDVSAASVGTLISGAGIVFSNGGVAAGGQTRAVTVP